MLINVFGAGGGAKELYEMESIKHYDLIFIEDLAHCESLFGFPVISEKDFVPKDGSRFFCTAFDAEYKRRVYKKYKDYFWYNIVAANSDFQSYGVIEYNGLWVLPNTHVGESAKLGNLVRINYGAQITHDCEIGDYSFIGINASMCSHSVVGSGCFIGSGSVLIEGVKVGDNTTIGAGSVVTKDIPANVVAWGNPCRVMRLKDGR